MHAFRSWRASALAVIFALTAPVAQAGMITPDSIPNPPSAVSSANGTPVYANNLVTTQYAGLGLNFSDTTITRLNGISVWAPVAPVSDNSSSGILSYFGSWTGGKFVMPGSSNPTTISSLSVEVLGKNLGFMLSVYGPNAQQLNLLPVLQSHPGPHGGQVWTFTGSGIASFSGIIPTADGLPNPSWGVAEISFTPSSAPEPSSLVLAGLGALGMATRLGWRRIRRVA